MIAHFPSAPLADLESTTLINLDEGEPSSQTMSAADFDDFLSSVTTTTSPAVVAPSPVEPPVVAPPATNGTRSMVHYNDPSIVISSCSV